MNKRRIVEAPVWETGVKDFGQDVITILKNNSTFLHWGPILAILMVFTIGLSTTLVHQAWWPLTTPSGCFDLLLFFTWNYMVLRNMYLSSIIGNFVDLGWSPPNDDHKINLQFCKRCKGFKVPRSHHCSKCDRCVMKMDHHCPWINNCVGHRNHGFFIRFLLFAVIGSLHGAIILTICLYYTILPVFALRSYSNSQQLAILIKNRPITSIYLFIFSLIGLALSYGVIVAIGILLILQLKNISSNKTAIEHYICKKADYYRKEKPFVFPYDLGWKRNFMEVFGGNGGFPRGNGVWWPVVFGCTQFSFSEEQLIQKAIKNENSRMVQIHKEFSGGYFGSLRFGLRVFSSQPCNEELRLKIRRGEVYLVTRICNRWLYGYQVSSASEDDGTETLDSTAGKQEIHLRGWFPRECVLPPDNTKESVNISKDRSSINSEVPI